MGCAIFIVQASSTEVNTPSQVRKGPHSELEVAHEPPVDTHRSGMFCGSGHILDSE